MGRVVLRPLRRVRVVNCEYASEKELVYVVDTKLRTVPAAVYHPECHTGSLPRKPDRKAAVESSSQRLLRFRVSRPVIWGLRKPVEARGNGTKAPAAWAQIIDDY